MGYNNGVEMHPYAIGKQLSEFAQAGVSVQQLRMIDAREGLSVIDKIGNFSNFASRYAKFAKAGKFLGKANNVANAYNTISDYYDPNVSSVRFSYRLGSTAASIGTSAAVGFEFGGPPGTLAGFIMGLGTNAGEIIYDGWNNTIMPVINQGVYTINNGGYANFHP
jgi:hypothetical protein